METCYKLAPGVQVRKEDFGLLFYKMKGPRLFFLPSKNLLEENFFKQKTSLRKSLSQRKEQVPNNSLEILQKALQQLIKKGVILEY
jgi:putative mycofactocin binding protein MftB